MCVCGVIRCYTERGNVVKMATSSSASLNFDQRTGDTGDPSNELHLVDKKNTKSDIWKYFALRVN